MRKIISGFALLVLVIIATAAFFPGTETYTSNERVPFEMRVDIPCANGGTGEIVYLSGTLHILNHITIAENGKWAAKWHFQPMGVSGTGLTTGDKFQATGLTQERVNISGDSLPYVYTYVNNFRIIGQGPGNNYLVHEVFHITINNKGDTTAEVSNFSAECR